MKKYLIPIFFCSLTACNPMCKDLDSIKDLPSIKASDRNLNCRQIEYEIIETDSRTRALKYQNANIVDYSELSFTCLIRASVSAKLGLINAEQRLDYLFELYEFKGCDLVKSLKRPDSLTNSEFAKSSHYINDDNENLEQVPLPITATSASPAQSFTK